MRWRSDLFLFFPPCLCSTYLIVYLNIGCFVNGCKSTMLSKGIWATLKNKTEHGLVRIYFREPQLDRAQYSWRNCLLPQSGDLIMNKMKVVFLFNRTQFKLKLKIWQDAYYSDFSVKTAVALLHLQTFKQKANKKYWLSFINGRFSVYMRTLKPRLSSLNCQICTCFIFCWNSCW